MQRGTTRPRSPSDSDESEHDRPRQRSRHSVATAAESMSMGHQIQSNGSSTAGPSNGNGVGNGHDDPTGAGVRLAKLDGKLMYEDDSDWAEYQDGIDAIMMEADAEGSDDTKRRRKTGVAAGKRMPVDREEVVRLILQGLRDIGYKWVQVYSRADVVNRRIRSKPSRGISSRHAQQPTFRLPSLVAGGMRHWNCWASLVWRQWRCRNPHHRAALSHRESQRRWRAEEERMLSRRGF